jgi:hypothetical protein
LREKQIRLLSSHDPKINRSPEKIYLKIPKITFLALALPRSGSRGHPKSWILSLIVNAPSEVALLGYFK